MNVAPGRVGRDGTSCLAAAVRQRHADVTLATRRRRLCHPPAAAATAGLPRQKDEIPRWDSRRCTPETFPPIDDPDILNNAEWNGFGRKPILGCLAGC